MNPRLPQPSARLALALRRRAVGALSVAAVLAASPGLGEPAARAPRSVGAQSIDGVLRVSACEAPTCPVAADDPALTLPDGVTGQPTVESARLDDQITAAVVRYPAGTDGRAYALVIVPDGTRLAPRVVYRGFLGETEESDGSRVSTELQVVAASPGRAQIWVGKRTPAWDLCGRPTLHEAAVLDPARLKFRSERWPPLAEPEKAPLAEIEAMTTDEPPPGRLPERRSTSDWMSAGLPSWRGTAPGSDDPRVPRPGISVGGVGGPESVVDGAPGTGWAPDARGSSWLLLRTPTTIPLSAILIYPHVGRALPPDLWVVTDGAVLHARLTSFLRPARVALPPGPTRCVALVAFGVENVAVSEVRLEPALGGDPDRLALELGHPERQAAAVALLRAMGAAGLAATRAAWPRLDSFGKRAALAVLAEAPCGPDDERLADALGSTDEELVLASLPIARRCEGVGDELERRIGVAERRVEAQRWLGALGRLSPDRALRPTLAVTRSDVAKRADHRSELAAVVAASSIEAVLAVVSDADLAPVQRVELMFWAAGRDELAPALGPAFAGLAELATGDFALRYALVPVAARLAERGDASASAWLSVALSDERWEIRALAAEHAASRGVAVTASLADTQVRVRLAAAAGLTTPDAAHVDSLLVALDGDRWPSVRGESAAALARAGADEGIDQALLAALRDRSPGVRARVARALGDREVADARRALGRTLRRRGEDPRVRAAAARALADLCDTSVVGTLTKLSEGLARPGLDEWGQLLARESLFALYRIDPPGFARRSAFLEDTELPAAVRGLRERAVDATDVCSAPVAGGGDEPAPR